MTALVYSGAVIDAGEMRAERERRGLTQDELGALLDEPGKNIGNWERQGHIPPKKRRKVQERLFGDTATGLAAYSDMALLAELALRLDRSRAELSALPNEPLPKREEDSVRDPNVRGTREENDLSLGETWINADPD